MILTFQTVEVGEQQITQFREFSKIYNKMSELCFNVCVWDFNTNEVPLQIVSN